MAGLCNTVLIETVEESGKEESSPVSKQCIHIEVGKYDRADSGGGSRI